METEDYAAIGLAPFTGGLSLFGSPTIRKKVGDIAGSAKDHMPGRDTTRPANFAESGLYNPNAFHYGGQPGGAYAAGGRYGGMMDQANGRAAFAAGRANDWDQTAGGTLGLGLHARAGQQQMAEMMQRRAMGLMPSIAQQQADRQMQQATAAQGSLAASARGPAALALAQQTAANNVANAHGAISGQAQINAGTERLQAGQAANDAYGLMRQGDTMAANAAAGMYGQANTASYQAGQTGLGYGALENRVHQGQLDAQGAGQGVLARSIDSQNTGIMQQSAGNAKNEMDMFKGVLGMAEGKMGTPGGAAPRAAGGPVSAGGLYLVGERGPELMVPSQSGRIVPNHRIRGLY